MLKFFILLVCCCFLISSTVPKQANRKTILAIVAHPDDEMAIADVLVKYRKLGYKVFVMIATDGKSGVRVTSIPEGDSLGNLRQGESNCACKIMGVEPPIFLSIERLDTKIGVRNYFNAHKQLRDSLIQRIPAINPDLIITFGPDGDSHHAEHIVVGSAVTEVLLQKGWVKKHPLYYFAYNQRQAKGDDLGYIANKYINVEVNYSQEDEMIGLAAYKCYVTQFTSSEIQADYDRKVKDTVNKAYFRRFSVAERRQKGFYLD
jgi:N-acetylglucosamine malate deacetylase 2